MLDNTEDKTKTKELLENVKMELIRGIHNIQAKHKGCVLTIGNFDGVHRGHAQVIANLLDKAKHYGLPATVMLFEPQPQERFRGVDAPARISLLRDKLTLLAELGVDRVLVVNFSQSFATISASQFIEDLLVAKLGIKYLVVGDDFCFGKQRQGNFDMLQSEGEQHAFAVESTASFLIGDHRVSSTLIREQLAKGDLEEARRLLGHGYSLNGRVIHGQKLGRTLGFPTANVALKRLVVPVRGVYAVTAKWDDGKRIQTYQGVANIGFRPTVNGQHCLLETHLFDFAGDLYGQHLQIELFAKIRDEQPFSSLEALKQQILQDVASAKALFTDDVS